MSLSYAIEYLLSLQREGGGNLVAQGATQIFIPIFPPYRSVVLNVIPEPGDYANLMYIKGWSTTMVPDAFHDVAQVWGTRNINHILSGDWLQREHADIFILETHAQPSFTRFTNRTPLFQYYESTIGYLIIKTKADWDTCIEALKRMGTSAESEQLAAESNRLLNLMVEKMSGGSA